MLYRGSTTGLAAFFQEIEAAANRKRLRDKRRWQKTPGWRKTLVVGAHAALLATGLLLSGMTAVLRSDTEQMGRMTYAMAAAVLARDAEAVAAFCPRAMGIQDPVSRFVRDLGSLIHPDMPSSRESAAACRRIQETVRSRRGIDV